MATHPPSTEGRAIMRREDRMPDELPTAAGPAGPDAHLVWQLREGDVEAGQQFVREHYAGIYRYLLYLTGRRELAEDLTQETFLQAWRRLETFDSRGPLRPWLHRIAHREFLQALRSQHSEATLEEIPEAAAPHAGDLTELVELRAVMARLPLEEREVLVLHYLEGYRYQEIAHIVGAPVTTVKYRLAAARAHLKRELGEGDLAYLNQAPGAALRRWSWLPLEALTVLEGRLSLAGGGGWEESTARRSREGVTTMSDNCHAGMSRRKLLSAAVGAAAGLAGPVTAATPNEAEIIDDRLTRKVTLSVKATAQGDLCEQLHRDTGIAIAAGPSVADEKVTLFCEKLPLREVMRQLSRPFGYTWLRTGQAGGYRYELVQELRSQLLEEELRNRDRSAAFLALERELQRYRDYLDLSPDDALARAKTAGPEEKPLLEKLGRSAWGAVQIYFRLTPQQQAALRAGEELRFSQAPEPGELPLSAEIARGIHQSLRDVVYHKMPDGFGLSTGVKEPQPGDLPPAMVPEARATMSLSIRESEPGHLALKYVAGTFSQSDLPRNSRGATWEGDGSLAIGISPAVEKPDNRVMNARLAREPALQRLVSMTPGGSCGGQSSALGDRAREKSPHPPSDAEHSAPNARATSADALEALHRAAGLPIVSDFYTHLYAPEALVVQDQPLFDALNRLADTMRLRWGIEGETAAAAGSAGARPWLEFRSTSYYADRLKEVPNRLLTRWAAARRQHGLLTLDDLCEIVQLTDAQLDAAGPAEGARACHGLIEWDLARKQHLRPHLRFLAELTPAQRQEAMSAAGLAFTRMSLPQQQRYIALAFRFGKQPLQSLDELAGAMMRVVYTQPGWFMWMPPGPNWYQWVAPVVPGREGTRTVMPPVVARTREAALAAARQIDPHLLELILPEARRLDPRVERTAQVPDAGEIKTTDLELTIVYVPGLSSKHEISLVGPGDYSNSTW